MLKSMSSVNQGEIKGVSLVQSNAAMLLCSLLCVAVMRSLRSVWPQTSCPLVCQLELHQQHCESRMPASVTREPSACLRGKSCDVKGRDIVFPLKWSQQVPVSIVLFPSTWPQAYRSWHMSGLQVQLKHEALHCTPSLLSTVYACL